MAQEAPPAPHPPAQTRQPDFTPATHVPPPLYVAAPPPSRSVLVGAIQVVALVLLLTLLGGTLFVIFTVVSLVGMPSQVTGGVGGQVTGAATEVQRVLDTAAAAVRGATDPARPPVGLVHDTEFSALEVWRAGQTLPGGRDYGLSLQSVRRRENSESADTALYAVVHAELRQPREFRLFGQLLRSDADPHDHILYKGETFRIGPLLYRVNWISQDGGTLAAGMYRQPDAVSSPLKLEYE